MFIKLGEEIHLSKLKEKGEIFFNPCKYFRDLEFEQMHKGIGDGEDGGINVMGDTVTMSTSNGKVVTIENQRTSFIVDPCLKTPTFCLRKNFEPYITSEYRKKLLVQFPKHTHALILEDENAFIENIRYNFKSRAFAHEIFYQDYFFTDFMNFLRSGESDISFYIPKSKSRYYANFRSTPDSGNEFFVRIDDSNFYKTMFRKESFFLDQVEYRIVLPYEKIQKGQLFKISPVEKGYICNIDELIK